MLSLCFTVTHQRPASPDKSRTYSPVKNNFCMFRCAQLGTRVGKLSQELKEEQEMNCCLRANQTQLQTQLAEEERKSKENGEEQAFPANVTHMSIDSHTNPKRLQCKRKPQHSYLMNADHIPAPPAT